MKKIFLFLLALISIMQMEVQANKSTVYMSFPRTEFTFSENVEGMFISVNDMDFHYHENGEPCLPYFTRTIAIPSNYSYKSFTYGFSGGSLISSKAVLANAPEVFPTSEVRDNLQRSSSGYDVNKYPTENVCLTTISRWSNMTVLHFEVCPFIYDAKENTLRMVTRVRITIDYDIINKAPNLDGYTFSPAWPLDQYDFNIGFSDNEDNPVPVYGENDVEYLIVTKNSLKSAFQPLADWKKKKGIRSKIITVEDIIRSTGGKTLQLKIKNAIHKYYKKNKLKYVLLGGDASVIPPLMCF